MLDVLLTASVSFIITFLAVPVIIKIAEQKKLYDVPDGRKLHSKPITSLGGVGIFIGFFLASILTISSQVNPEFQYFFGASIVMFFLGIKDDILILTAMKKFIGQVLAAAILIHLGGIRIDSMHGLFGIHELPYTFSLALSYITIIVVVNAYNLIDGVDGLAATLGLLTMSLFGAYFFLAGFVAYALLAFAMAGSLLAFLIFNYNPAKIFMGDSGALLLGLINAILAIKFITVADGSYTTLPVESAVAIGFSILMVPLADTLRVFSIRIVQGRSPFSPDRNHFHHLLLDRGFNHKHVTFTCLSLNILFICISYFGRAIGPTYVMLILLGVAITVLAMLVYLVKPMRGYVGSEGAGSSVTKVVPISNESAVAEN